MASSSGSSGLPSNIIPAVPAIPMRIRRPDPPRAYEGMSNLKRALCDENMMQLAFSEWKEDMGRTYPTIEEERRRFEIFKSSVAIVVSQNPNSVSLGLSNFVDWTDEELDNHC